MYDNMCTVAQNETNSNLNPRGEGRLLMLVIPTSTRWNSLVKIIVALGKRVGQRWSPKSERWAKPMGLKFQCHRLSRAARFARTDRKSVV